MAQGDRLTLGGVEVVESGADSWDGPFWCEMADGTTRTFATLQDLAAEARKDGFVFDGIESVNGTGAGRA